MDLFSFIGICVGFGALVLGAFLEGNALGALLNPVALLIVLGGTVGAVMLHTPTRVFLLGISALPRVFYPPNLETERVIKFLCLVAKTCKSEGLIQAANFEKRTSDPFIQKSIKMLSDNVKPALIADILTRDIELEERNHQLSSDLYKSLGGYSPTIGLAGAILGLINVMQHLSEPDKLGHGLVVAFTATLYGVVFANLAFLPVSEKLNILSEKEATFRHMILAGILSIRDGESVAITESRMRSFMDARFEKGWS